MSSLIVIGGGAAGLVAAGRAVALGKNVTVIEKNARPARKVMITGKGRCNVTNACDVNTFMQSVVSNPKFLYSALHTFSSYDMIELLECTCQLPLKTERGNRVFPVSDKAVDVVDALCRYSKGADFIFATTVTEILTHDNRVIGVRLSDGRELSATSVVLATGGLSYPATGSTGDGYSLAKAVGHTVTPLGGSLVSIESSDAFCKDLMGLSLKNVTLTVYRGDNNKQVYSELGEMLFTHFGISGPLVLSASAHLRNFPPEGYRAVIDLKPGLTKEQLDARLIKDFHEAKTKAFRNSLGGLLPRKLIPVMVKLSGIDGDTPAGQITKEQRIELVDLFKNLTLTLTALRPVEEAVVTYGGIKVSEINPKTMESKLIKGLHFAGELIDVDAYTGGYNLQIAFSTGYVAGEWAE